MTDLNLRNRMKRPALVAALLATTIFGGGAVVGHAWSATNPASPPITVHPAVQQAGFAELVKKVTPAVVKISTTETAQEADAQGMPRGLEGLPPEFRHFFEQAPGSGHQRGGTAHALGSGFVVDPAGYIVTNNHVVDGAQQIRVTTNDGDTYQAKVVGRDAKTDVAVLKIDAGKALPYVAFGDSDQAQVGDWVIAVGNPFGLSGTATAGIISAHGRSINEGPYDDFLQVDAPINPGNSGGPLFNQSGQVIGIDTAIYSPNGGNVGIGFAIPSNMASNVVAQLRDHGKVERGWLGVQMQGVTPALAKAMGMGNAEGVLIDKVLPNSPATKTLQQGDVITAFNGKAIKSPRDLAMDVADAKAGSTANLSVYREGHQQSVQVTIGSPSQQKTAQAETPRGGKVGVALAPLNDEARSALGVDDQTNGVVVAQVRPGSLAAESGLRADDVITRIGQDQVTSPSDAAAKIRAAEHAKKSSVPLLIVRDGTSQFLALALNGNPDQAG